MSVGPIQITTNNTPAPTPAANTSKVNAREFTYYSSEIDINWHSNPVADVITKIGNLVAKAFVTLFVDLPRFAAYQLGLNDGTASHFTNRQGAIFVAALANNANTDDVDSDEAEFDDFPSFQKTLISASDHRTTPKPAPTTSEFPRNVSSHPERLQLILDANDGRSLQPMIEEWKKQAAGEEIAPTEVFNKTSPKDIEDTAVSAAPNSSLYLQVAEKILVAIPIMVAISLAFTRAREEHTRKEATCPDFNQHPACAEPLQSPIRSFFDLLPEFTCPAASQSLHKCLEALSNYYTAALLDE